MIWIECVLCFFNFYNANVKIQRKWARRGEEKRGARGRLDERGKEEACYKYHNYDERKWRHRRFNRFFLKKVMK